jgi:hypothetical protein
MILAINGKRVGGMTVFSVTLELEIGGSELMLAVAKYRFPKDMENEISKSESSILNQLDSIANDDRILDWIDIFSNTVQETMSISHVCEKDQKMTTFHSDCLDAIDSVLNSYSESKISKVPNDGTLFSNPDKQSVLTPAECGTCIQCSETVIHHASPQWNTCHLIDGESGDNIDTCRQKLSLHMPIVSYSKPHKNQPKSVESESNHNIAQSDASNTSSSENTDRGLVKLPCVCGILHRSGKYNFWIQCFECESWYKVNTKCIGFTRREAEYIEQWTCPGCTATVKDCNAVERNSGDADSMQPIGYVKGSPREELNQLSHLNEKLDLDAENQDTNLVKADGNDATSAIIYETTKMQKPLEQTILNEHYKKLQRKRRSNSDRSSIIDSTRNTASVMLGQNLDAATRTKKSSK